MVHRDEVGGGGGRGEVRAVAATHGTTTSETRRVAEINGTARSRFTARYHQGMHTDVSSSATVQYHEAARAQQGVQPMRRPRKFGGRGSR